MTDNQIKYQSYCKRSKSLCIAMEQLTEEADYHEKRLNYNSRDLALDELKKVKDQLEDIWDVQVELFYKIQDDYSKQKQAEIEKIMTPTLKKRSSKAIEQARPVNYKVKAMKWTDHLMKGL